MSNTWFKKILMEMIHMPCHARPELTEDRIEQIRSVIRQNPDWNRTRISNQICMLWEWQSPNGHMKDVSCRDMLRALDKAGKIKLPAAQKPSRAKGTADIVKHMEHDRTPVRATLAELRPLRVSIVSVGEELAQFKSMLSQHHYLGFDRSIGENMKYAVYSRDRKLLSCLMFGSAAWSCRDRDRFIGWDREEKLRSLSMVTNNSRFLIPEWIFAPHLASHVLSLISRRIAGDWLHKYGHPVYCLETCVETGRFRGTCYRAANWVKVGATTGRGRDGGHQNAILPIKDVYLYPLAPNFRQLLSGKNTQAPNGGLEEASAQ
jgi:hypothetical protein